MKFGLIFDLIVIILGAIDYLVETYVINWIPIIFLFLALPGAIILQIITWGKCYVAIMSPPPMSCFLNENSMTFLIIILDIIFYFLIGALIGKIKSKLQNEI